jgi:hypothetical protein
MSMTNKSARQVESSGWALLLLLVVLFVVTDRSNAAENTTILSATEARILVYVSPVGEGLRASGSDIAMEQQTSAQLNQADYYYFWVYNAKRQSNGSVTIGYYAVNKHTADVWDTVEQKRTSSKLMVGVQRIIRESHHIDEDTMEKYRSRPF